MSDTRGGVLAMIAACVIWGLSPLYYKALAHVPPLEILAHRTLWSFVLFAALLLWQGRFGQLLHALAEPRQRRAIALAGVLIAVNWFTFILAIQIGRATEASMGYYIFPLVSVALGALVLGERPGRWQWVAVGLAAAAVTLLAAGLGAAPWVALVVSFSFGFYGLVKKRLAVGPVVSVTGEVALLLPLALVWLAGVGLWGWTGPGGQGGHFGSDVITAAMLVLSGLLTAGPLILFTIAAQRLRLATVGVLQYLNPTLQFLVATLVFAEPFTRWHGLAFGLIWVAVGLYSWAGWQAGKRRQRADSSSGTSATTVK